MCGLAGVAGNTNVRSRDAFIDLLTITQLRGKDSTGVFSVKGEDTVDYAKQLGPPEWLFDTKSFDRCVNGVPKIMAGHCRSKTVGDNTRDNAHPYDFEDLIGMHNGTLRGHYSLDGYDYKRTDSWAMYNHINRFGIEETMKQLDPDGAWALVWWDKNEKRLNFLRNDKRPLWFAWAKDKTQMFWCSEPWMFSAVNRVVDLWDGKATAEGEKDTSPYFQLPPDTLWSFSVAAYPKPGEKYLTFHQPHAMKAEGKKPMGFTRDSSVSKGGEVTNPFFHGQGVTREAADAAYQRLLARQKNLDDSLEGIGHVAQEEPGTSITTQRRSENPSSNVLDFRRGPTHGRSSSQKTLSLPPKSSELSQRNSSEKSTDSSKESCEKTGSSSILRSQEFPQVSLRDVAGTQYITHNLTSSEIPIQEFEARTGGKCSYCKKPIGGLEEVAAFTNKAMSGFICTSCVAEPEIALVG